MQEKLQLLKELQALDADRQSLLQQRQKFVDEQDVLQTEVDRIQGMVDSLAEEMDGLNEERRELARALTIEEENVERSESRLPQIKTQKEYVAVLKEIDTAKKLLKELSEKIADKDKSLAGLGEEKQEKDKELAELNQEVATRRAEIGAKLAEVDERLASMTDERNAFLEKLPKSLRKRYNLLLERRDGIAVVEARDGACLGCNMQLPPQQFNSLYTASEVQSCPQCNRLLFIADRD